MTELKRRNKERDKLRLVEGDTVKEYSRSVVRKTVKEKEDKKNVKGYDGRSIKEGAESVSPRPAGQRTQANPASPTTSRPPKTPDSDVPPDQEDTYEDVEDMRSGMGRTIRISAKTVIDALRKTDGMKTQAAKLLKVEYNTLTKYIKQNKKVQEELIAIEETMLDLVQSNLMKTIKKGNVGAMYFYLRCKGKSRGFIESAQHALPPTQPITFKYQLVLPEGYKQEQKLIEDKPIDITPIEPKENGEQEEKRL